MDRRSFVKTLPALTVLAGEVSGFAEELRPITLPQPEKEGGKSLLAALWERGTNRNISEQKLPPQVLSNLLIAGNVYLFAAAYGLAAWFHNCNRTGLTAELKLRPEQRVLFAQTVGYPQKT